MLGWEGAVSRSEALRGVKLQIPDGVSSGQVIKALEATVHRMRVEVEADHPHSHMDVMTKFSKENPASKALMVGIDRAYDQMTESLVKEVTKVLRDQE